MVTGRISRREHSESVKGRLIGYMRPAIYATTIIYSLHECRSTVHPCVGNVQDLFAHFFPLFSFLSWSDRKMSLIVDHLAPTPFILFGFPRPAGACCTCGVLPDMSVFGLVQSSSMSSIDLFRLSPKMTFVPIPIDPFPFPVPIWFSWVISGIDPEDRNS